MKTIELSEEESELLMSSAIEDTGNPVKTRHGDFVTITRVRYESVSWKPYTTIVIRKLVVDELYGTQYHETGPEGKPGWDFRADKLVEWARMKQVERLTTVFSYEVDHGAF